MTPTDSPRFRPEPSRGAAVLLVAWLCAVAPGCPGSRDRAADPGKPESAIQLPATGDPSSTEPPMSPPPAARNAQSRSAAAITAAAAGQGSESGAEPPAGAIHFQMLGAEAGLDFTRFDDLSPERRITESTGGGVAMIDIDSDGWLDLFYTGGSEMPPNEKASEPSCGLFRNLGERQFQNVTMPAALTQGGYCQGTAVGDTNGDGFDDLYVAAMGPNGLWQNNGDGTFSNVTQRMGAAVPQWSTSCAMADFDGDGHLDLYVVNYLDEDPREPLLCANPQAPQGYEQCPPSKFAGVDDVLLLNDGEGGFVDATESAGLRGLAGKGLGVVVCDFDDNGRPEIYVANDGEANFLLVPSSTDGVGESPVGGRLAYDERGLSSGGALSRSGYAQASMGVAAGDYDNSGSTDLLLTHFYGDSNTLYRNEGGLRFEDVTRSTGLAGPSRKALGWGTVLADLDNDGWLDLFVANGHVEDRRWMERDEPYAMQPHLFRNQKQGRFDDVSRWGGPYFERPWLGRGAAVGDLDRDGRLDLAVSHQVDPSLALWNRTDASSPHAKGTGMTLRLVGTRSNRNGYGAKVEVLDRAGKVVAVRELCGGASFQSASAAEIHLALGPGAQIRILWPSGTQETTALTGGASEIVVEGRPANRP